MTDRSSSTTSTVSPTAPGGDAPPAWAGRSAMAHGHGEAEHRTSFGTVAGVDPAAVGVDDGPADGEADPAAAAARTPPERLEELLALRQVETGAPVGDEDLHPLARTAGSDGD